MKKIILFLLLLSSFSYSVDYTLAPDLPFIINNTDGVDPSCLQTRWTNGNTELEVFSYNSNCYAWSYLQGGVQTRYTGTGCPPPLIPNESSPSCRCPSPGMTYNWSSGTCQCPSGQESVTSKTCPPNPPDRISCKVPCPAGQERNTAGTCCPIGLDVFCNGTDGSTMIQKPDGSFSCENCNNPNTNFPSLTQNEQTLFSWGVFLNITTSIF